MRAMRSGRAEVADQVDDATLAATVRNAATWRWSDGWASGRTVHPADGAGPSAGRDHFDRHRGTSPLRRGRPALAAELARRAALAVDNARLYHGRQARQEAEAADRAKGRFLAVLSHELRNPLSPVLMAVSALLDGDETLEIRPTLEMIRRNVELEARLIDDLLDVTRIGRGTLPLDPRRASTPTRPSARPCISASVRSNRVGLRGDGPDRYRALRGGRSGPAPTDHLEPDQECHQVHPARRVDRRPLPQPTRPAAWRSTAPVIEVADDGAGIERRP